MFNKQQIFEALKGHTYGDAADKKLDDAQLGRALDALFVMAGEPAEADYRTNDANDDFHIILIDPGEIGHPTVVYSRFAA